MSSIIFKTRCPACREQGNDNSGNNLTGYLDGSGHCFACGWHTNNYTESTSSEPVIKKDTNINMDEVQKILETSTVRTISSRAINKRIAELYGVRTVNYNGNVVLAFPYYKNGEISGFKLKYRDGTYQKVGDSKECDMFGYNHFDDPKGRTLVITEGELDAMACSQVLGPTWHCTSIKDGSNSAKQFVLDYYDKLVRYDNIVLSFDNGSDSQGEAGRKAVKSFIAAYNKIGTIRVATLPLKDANEMLMASRGEELKWALIKSETYKPKQIVELDDIIKDVLVKPQMGRQWPWSTLTKINHGAYLGKKYLIGGPTDCGKTTVLKMIVQAFTETQPLWKGGLFFLEQRPKDILHKLIGGKVNKDLEQPTTEWWDEDKIKEIAQTFKSKLYFFDPQYGINLKDVLDSIYYFANVNKVQFIIIDNLTILSSTCKIDGKRVPKEEFYNEVGTALDRIALELNIAIFVVGHVNKNSIARRAALGTRQDTLNSYKDKTAGNMKDLYNNLGLTWESGRIADIDDIDGGKIASRLFHEVWILSRNRVSTDEFTSRIIRLDVVKCKQKAKDAPLYFEIIWDPETGNLVELKR